MTASNSARKQQILQSLAQMLEQGQNKKITTAELARQVGVSEAALYRHFPSKAKMYEGLIDFTEDTLFSRMKSISNEAIRVEEKCYRSLTLLLTFSERNPGISRLITGEPLTGETPRLVQRVQQLFERIETQLKQLIKESEYKEKTATTVSSLVAANTMTALVEGKIRQFIRSDFNKRPTDNWPEQWQLIEKSIFIQS